MDRKEYISLINEWRSFLVNEEKKIISERGRFKPGTELNAWLVGINKKDFSASDFVDAIKEIDVKPLDKVDGKFAKVVVFKKDKSVYDKFKKIIGKEYIDDSNSESEFGDDLPVFITRNLGGDINAQKSSILSLNDSLDWATHDMWHLIVDFGFYIKRFFKASGSIHISDTLEYYIDRSFKFDDNDTAFMRDSLKFLESKNFTKGVGGVDFVPSLAAYCVMNRDKKTVSEQEIEWEDFETFSEFYERLHVFAPLLWNAVFKELKNKIIFYTFPT